ncbi:MAG TPA: hypothetical protein VI488_00380 [Candidatus Angelobacter sp.]
MKSSRQAGRVRGLFEFTLLGAVVFGAGVLRFILHRHFTLVQAAYCLGAIPAALVLLMIFDYTLHHARIACLMVLVILLLLAVTSPAFCVGLGLTMLGIVVTKRP